MAQSVEKDASNGKKLPTQIGKTTFYVEIREIYQNDSVNTGAGAQISEQLY